MLFLIKNLDVFVEIIKFINDKINKTNMEVDKIDKDESISLLKKTKNP